MSIEEFIEKQTWIFAKTYADKCPHEYIVRYKHNLTDEDFLWAVNYIKEHGIVMYFWSRANWYFFSGEYYYWAMDGADGQPLVINRAKVDDYKISVMWKGKKDVSNLQGD